MKISLMEQIKERIKKKYNANQDELIPPEDMILLVGGGDFNKIGLIFFNYFVKLCNLKPNEKVLDVGCGVGRMALPLTDYLASTGSYNGFDIVPKCIEWCQENIHDRHPNFNFQLANIYNKEYNSQGIYQASKYRFPYANNSFDFVFLTSVFTHMLPNDMENYLSEIGRVLKPKGRCLVTYFLLNSESRKLIGSGRSTLNFIYDMDGYSTVNNDTPEAAIAYEEVLIQDAFERHYLMIRKPIYYGNWCGRTKFLSYQDVIIASKN